MLFDPSKTGGEASVLERNLRKLIVGQDEALHEIVNDYQMYLTGINAPGHPIGNFLLLGPAGSRKTRTVEATAEVPLKNPRAMIKIDCAEFQHSHEIAKLIGLPPGNRKGRDALWNMLLGIRDGDFDTWRQQKSGLYSQYGLLDEQSRRD